MLTQRYDGPQAWRADAGTARHAWYHELPAGALQELDRAVRQLTDENRTPIQTCADDFGFVACRAALRPVSEVLEHGRGFAIIVGSSIEKYSTREHQLVYWLIGQLLGRPIVQNVQGTMLYDVRDTGQDVRYGARFSVTNAESTFHTDASFGGDVCDYVGLQCLRTAKSGGLSQMVSAYAVHNVLLDEQPDMLETLYRPFHVDRRGGVRPGERLTIERPLFEWSGGELLCRYLRYWIEVGHEKVGQPLTSEQVRALDALDRVAARPELRVEFQLRPGDLYFLNNRWLMHNRTAFEDHAEPELKRHLVRLWLRRFDAGQGSSQ
jgi:alpha-ketoglutarate-dependent taurine dioxygenase